MEKIRFVPLYHKGKLQIAIQFKYNTLIRLHLKKLKDVVWSKTHKTFYINYSLENKKRIYLHLKTINVFIDGNELAFKKETEKKIHLNFPPLNKGEKNNIDRFKKWLQQKRLSKNTVQTYTDVTSYFIRYALLKNTTKYSTKLIEAFNYDFIVKPKKSISYQNQCINGIKKYLEYSNIDIEKINLERPRKQKKLPVVLHIDEVRKILDVTKNLKHKTLLSLLYSAGLRIGEAINLKVQDIDSSRMLIYIKNAKGKKDRYTLLSENFLTLLRNYYREYRPKEYLFEGQKNKQYSFTSAQKVLKNATKKTGLQKQITLHTLRHSFATHLLENGTDIRYIQELLGHSNPKTTMIYTHVTQTSIRNIKNPFDNL